MASSTLKKRKKLNLDRKNMKLYNFGCGEKLKSQIKCTEIKLLITVVKHKDKLLQLKSFKYNILCEV